MFRDIATLYEMAPEENIAHCDVKVFFLHFLLNYSSISKLESNLMKILTLNQNFDFIKFDFSIDIVLKCLDIFRVHLRNK